MIAERRGVEAHQIVMSTSMPCFTLKKKKVYKGGGGRETKGPPLQRPCFVAQFALHMPNAHASVSNRPCGYKNLLF